MAIRILLADDHKLVREGLCSLLQKESDFEIVAQAENGRDAVRFAREYHPEIAVLDVHMPDLNGADAARQILDENPDIRIIALSVNSSRKFVNGMLKAGASGYLVKTCAYDELTNAIRIVSGGQSYLSPQLQHMLIKNYVANIADDDNSATSILTKREKEVLKLIAEGLTSKKIASRLHLSDKTIATHRLQIMNKLNLKNVADLTRFAVKEGIVSISD